MHREDPFLVTTLLSGFNVDAAGRVYGYCRLGPPTPPPPPSFLVRISSSDRQTDRETYT